MGAGVVTKKLPAKAVKTAGVPVGRGRPSVYTDEIAESICQRLRDGETLNAICKSDEMPSEATVRAWALDDHCGFSAKYARARELGYLKLADEIIEIADTPLIGEKTVETMRGTDITRADMVDRSRLKVDTRKWMLSKMLPKVYGDKIAVDHSGKVGFDNAPVEELTTALNDLLAKLK